MIRALPRPLTFDFDVRRTLHLALVALSAVVVPVLLWRMFSDPWGGDALSYWRAWRESPMYGRGWDGGYVYSPAFAQALAPLLGLPLHIFYILWVGIGAVAMLYLVGPAWIGLTLLAFWPAYADIWVGNIHLLLACVLVLGMRYPSVWAFALLTKITPGVGLVWFAVRREWRHLFGALAWTAMIVAVSALFAPDLWVEWLGFLGSQSESIQSSTGSEWSVRVRAPIAAVLIGLAAWRNRPAAIPLAVYYALPAMWVASPAVWLAIPRLAGWIGARRSLTPARRRSADPAPLR